MHKAIAVSYHVTPVYKVTASVSIYKYTAFSVAIASAH